MDLQMQAMFQRSRSWASTSGGRQREPHRDHKTLSRSAFPWGSAFWMLLMMIFILLLLLLLTHNNKALENIRG